MYGQTKEAQQNLRELERLAERRYVSPVFMATIYVCLGNEDRAFEMLEEAYRDHSETLFLTNIWPVYDRLRSDPRFADLMRRLGFQPD